MASSTNAQRGFIPPQNESEKLLMRRVEDLCRITESRGIVRYSAFLSDREQSLALAALNRMGNNDFSFHGGYSLAERKLLCIKPADADCEPPISCIKISCAQGSIATHKDYLGALLSLGIERTCLGDIIVDSATCAYVFVLKRIASMICMQLSSVGRYAANAEVYTGELPSNSIEREIITATISSLRADSLIAAMTHCSRGNAAKLINSGAVTINHVEVSNTHAAVFEGDIITIRGTGRFKLTEIGGKSRKDRIFINYFKY